MGVYCDIYDKYRVLELPWDSVITWIVAALCVDLGYYWGHRASHGKNDYNRTVCTTSFKLL